jgi:DNA invertase Pin-like site-specific DNA recombinase
MTGSLVDLAQEYVRLSSELEFVRRCMKAALANGEDSDASNPTRRRGARSGGGGMRDQLLAKAAEAEALIVSLLKDGPKKQTEIMAATGAPQSTTGQRLARLSEKRLVQRGDDGLWSAL